MNRRSGQVTTEYILLAAFLVTILVAISGILTSYIDRAGQEIETKASEVMAQRTIGIPLSWFFASSGGGVSGGGGALDDPAANDANKKGRGGGASGPGGGGPSGTNSGTSPTSPNSLASTSQKPGAGANKSGASANADEPTKGRSKRRRGRGGVIEVDDGSETDVASEQRTPEQKAEDEKSGKKTDQELEGASRRSYALTNDEDRRKGSCEDFDMFRMLKILALAALVVLGGAYLMSASGNRGGHKK